MALSTCRVFLLDEHLIVRRGLRALIEGSADIAVVGESGVVDGAPERVVEAQPDVVVVDLEFGDGLGLDVCRRVKALDPGVKVLLFADSAAQNGVAKAIVAGASGYLRKNIEEAPFLNALRLVATGHSLFDSAMAAEALQHLRSARDPFSDDLTSQERQILELIGQGKTNKQIAHAMHLSPHTVKNRVTSILAKLGVERRTQAAMLGTRG
ncbi:MAG TPA: response regulator transcription factor [Nocardioidaceae bacterium]|nr:response regulator transcription factor [Nocardioidaceae bacterium]